MERLQCKACGSYSMLPMELHEEDSDAMGILDDQETRFFTCHVCGDNWLSVREIESGDCRITFVHQMGLQPLLKRVAHMSTPVILSESAVDEWLYYYGEDHVDEQEWRERLETRRQILKSICTN